MKQSTTTTTTHSESLPAPKPLIEEAKSQGSNAGLVSELERLWKLKESGALSVDEYEKAKQFALKH